MKQDADGVPELVIEVVDGGSDERGTISMTWTREDLERLLADASEGDVVLTFDRDELAAALADVEAHGLRTRAAIFAVAAVGALGSGASIANAQVIGGDGGGTATRAPAAATTTDSNAAAAAALQARSEAMDAQYGLGTTASDATVTDASTGGYVTPNENADAVAALQARSEGLDAQYGLGANPSDATVTDASTGGYVTPDDNAAALAALQARSQGLDEQYGLAPGGQNDPAVQALQARGEALNAQFGLGGVPSDATVTDVSSGGGYDATPTATGGGFDIQSPSTDDALLAGAVLLTIAGAAFTVRRRSVPPPRPA